jgi:hypothetical protein
MTILDRRELYVLRLSAVMPGLVPGIHVFLTSKTWMAGTSPAMTPSAVGQSVA